MVLRLNRTGNPIDRVGRNNLNENWDNIERDFNNVVNVISESAYEQVVNSAKLIWQEPVDTFADLATTYPNAKEGWASMARDTGIVYRYDGTSGWGPIQQISAGPVNEVDHRLTTKLAQKTSVTPEDFEGNALQKLQQAFDYAIANRTLLEIKGTYDITGLGSIYINKEPYTFAKRGIFEFKGIGGSIKKTDAGYIFTSTAVDTSDIHVSGLHFESVSGAGVKVWDGNKIINIYSSDNTYLDIDTVAEANSRYAQGWNFTDDLVVGGAGWAFEFDHSYACNFNNVIIEWGEHGIRNSGFGYNFNHSLNIKGCTIQGLSGKGISLSGTNALSIDGNYFEYILGGYYIEITGLSNGGTIANNFIARNVEELTDTPAAIKLSGGPYKSHGNKVTNGALYETLATTAVYSDADIAGPFAIGDTSGVYQNVPNGDAVTLVNDVVVKRYGTITSYTRSLGTTLNGDAKLKLVFEMGYYIKVEDIVSIRLNPNGGDQFVNLLNYYAKDTTVVVNVQSLSGTPFSLNLQVTVLRVGNTSYYG